MAQAREKRMPRYVEKQLRDSVDCQVYGADTEEALLLAASRLGYEVDEEISRTGNAEEESTTHSVKIVKRDINEYGVEVVYYNWVHFNHPGPAYRKFKGEWFYYFLG